MTASNGDGSQLSSHAHRITAEIEHRLAHGQHASEVLHSEVHRLRKLDSHHGKLDKHAFHKDLNSIEHALHNRHHLPNLHLITHGAHAGELQASKHSTHAKPGALAAKGHTDDQHPSEVQPQRPTPPPLEKPLPQPSQHPNSAELPPEQPVIKPTQPAPHPESPQGADSVEQHLQAQTPGHLDTLQAAIDRAKAGGRPLTITQIGDSHIAFGTETPAIAAKLAQDFGLKPDQIRFSSVGDVGKTASFAKNHPGEFMKNVNKNTDLTIVSFGSNESTTQEGSSYAKDYASLVGQIRARNPGTAIAMVGPTDGNFWSSSKHLPGLESVAKAQESVAAAVPNSAYFRVAPLMGTVASMRSNGLMLGDNLHLTPSGYRKLGGIVADDIANSV